MSATQASLYLVTQYNQLFTVFNVFTFACVGIVNLEGRFL